MVNVLKAMIEGCGDTLDAIYIAGDLFEDSRYLRQADTHEAIGFITWLLVWCKSTNTALRVTEGTPSHDHGQSKMLEHANLAIGADCLFLDKIGIFYDEAIQATVGWVQDEYKAANADTINALATEQEMAQLMATRCLEKVDFFFMHGCFTFQLPVESPRSFNEEFWLSRVKHGIYIGHDHRRKTKDAITVTGSVERLSHGEEETKGMTIVDFNDTVVRNWFYENPNACPHRKVGLMDDYDKQYQACLDALRFIDEHPSSHIGRFAVEYHAGSPLAEHVIRWKKEYPFLIEGKKLPSPEEEAVLQQAFDINMPAQPSITLENIESITMERMASINHDANVASDIVRSLL